MQVEEHRDEEVVDYLEIISRSEQHSKGIEDYEKYEDPSDLLTRPDPIIKLELICILSGSFLCDPDIPCSLLMFLLTQCQLVFLALLLWLHKEMPLLLFPLSIVNPLSPALLLHSLAQYTELPALNESKYLNDDHEEVDYA